MMESQPPFSSPEEASKGKDMSAETGEEGSSNGILGTGEGKDTASSTSDGVDAIVASQTPSSGKRGRKRSRSTRDLSKQYACDWEGCGKVFSRPDHLSRHRLNHTPTQIFYCDRCTKVFVRADLLTRHAERHDRREAVSRAQYLQYANIPRATRPGASQHHSFQHPINQFQSPYSQPQTITSQPPNTSAASPVSGVTSSSHILASGESTSSPPGRRNSVSGPISTSAHSGIATHSGSQSTPAVTTVSTQTSPTQAMVGFPFPNPSASGSNSMSMDRNGIRVGSDVTTSQHSPSPGQNSSPSMGHNIVTSHSMSYGSQHSNSPPFPNFSSPEQSTLHGLGLDVHSSPPATSSSGAGPVPGLSSLDPLQSIFGPPSSMNNSGGPVPNSLEFGTLGFPTSYDQPFASANDLQWLLDGLGNLTPLANQDGTGNSGPSFMFDSIMPPPNQAPRSDSEHSPTDRPRSASSGSSTTRLPYLEPVPEPPRLPYHLDPATYVDPQTWQRLVSYLSPCLPSPSTHPKLSAASVQHYLHLYWTRIHETQYPIIHKATFNTSETPTPLLASMMILGCFYADPEAHQVGKAIHEKLRGMIICSDDFVPRADLWLFQSVILNIIFGKMCSDRKAHEMSHVFWGSVVTLLRRSALFSPGSVINTDSYKDDATTRWRAWTKQEEAKRASFTAFLIDVEHAAIFRHTPTLSAFQLQLSLPSDEVEWVASTASEWSRVHQASRPPSPFISALKASLITGFAPPSLNAFSRILVLHGLMSVAFDMQWRDHFLLGLAPTDGPLKDWRETISGALNCWKARLDQGLSSAKYPESQLLRASISLYAMAHITLSVDVHELQIWGGAERTLGLTVAPSVVEATRSRIHAWSSMREGRQATWHAAHFLRSSLLHRNQSSNDLSSCLHFNWSMYISVLTLYAFVTSLAGPPIPLNDGKNAAEEAMAFLESMCTRSPDDLPAAEDQMRRVTGLIHTIWELIRSSRWEIAEEGARILGGILHGVDNPSPPRHTSQIAGTTTDSNQISFS